MILPTKLNILNPRDGVHGLASRKGKGFPTAYLMPNIPPNPPLLPICHLH